MNWVLICFCVSALFGGFISARTPASPPNLTTLVGAEECLEGPSYWCRNFTTARQCNANRHCIRTVWEHQQLPPDNGEICTICINEVTQAREMLKSNETQQNLKLVLEGSCLILIPIKMFARECVKLMDNAIPELIEALSSEMSPEVVCHTAGLCNSPRMDALIAKYKSSATAKPKLDCDNCAVVAGMAERNFRAASRDHVLNSMLEVCGKMGSFSDGCSASTIVHFNSLYEALAAQLNPGGVCHLAGVCQQKYHNHSKGAEVKAVPELKGDVPCELCEQLVQHLRDILVANTTEKEFEQVLLGLCQATKIYKKECVDLVETYYPTVYAFLTEELDGKVVCAQIGICPRNGTTIPPLYPLLPAQVSQSLEKDSSGLHRVALASSGVTVHSGSHNLQVGESQLPLDSLVVVPQDKQLCQMCEYFLHFLQIELTSPVNEQAIINQALAACNGLPDTFKPTCRSFVNTYAAAVLALIAQDIDPSQVCPKIAVCPGFSNSEVGCEPCKVSTLQLTTRIGSNTTEANIQKELMTLCLTLPYEQSRHCSRVLAAHHEDLVDMVTAEFTSDEMCFFMNYCSAKPSLAPVGGDIETNEIPTAWEDENRDSDVCVLCEFVMKTLEKELEDNKTEAEIRVAVEHVCLVMPSTVRPKCRRFIDQYVDLIVTLLAESVDPKQVCQALNVCPGLVGLEYVRKVVNKCIACESLIGAMQGVMEDTNVERDLNRQLRLACLRLPNALKHECNDIVVQLAPQIEEILGELPLSPLVCQRLQLCTRSQSVDVVVADRCSEGQDYWCLSTTHAAACQKIEHCQKNVWLADKPYKKRETHTKKFLF